MLKYGVLGRLRVTAEGRELKLGGLRARRVLALLILRANRTVGIPRLANAAWGDEQPSTARRQVQNRIGALRAVLSEYGAVIETVQDGYRLHVRPGELDLQDFDRLVEQARADVANGLDPAASRRLFRQALALWRGPALADLGGSVLEGEAAALEERRAAAYGDCLELELNAGEGPRLIPELIRLVAEHPLQERFVEQLMLAYHRAGRRNDALSAYAELRTRIVEALGIEPGAHLRTLQQRILRGDQATEPASGEGRGPDRTEPITVTAPVASRPPTPRQLPGDNPAFTGREQELARIEQLSAPAAAHPDPAHPDLVHPDPAHADPGHAPGQPSAGVIIAIHGVGGVGKSTLAVHAAHLLADRFPDGQLYLDLQGSTPRAQPLSAEGALGRFLMAFGVAAQDVPAALPDAAARFRSEVANRRLLVVLDNARDAAQVRPLLPTAPGTVTLVTSRRILAELDGATPLPLDVPSEPDALAYLSRLVGAARTAAEPEASGQIVRRCGCLPLALRIVGARLAARPGWPLATMARKLADTGRRLDELQLSDLAVRTSMEVSYRELLTGGAADQEVARAFLLLGKLSGNDVGIPAAARLLALDEPEAERVLERAVDANVVESFEPGRYRMHDLLRLYASEQADQMDQTGPRGPLAYADLGPLGRVFDFYLDTAWAAAAVIRPGDHRTRTLGVDLSASAGAASDFGRLSEALDWMETEHGNLQAAVRQSAEMPGVPGTVSTRLAAAMFAFLRLRGYWGVLADVGEVALGVAERSEDLAAIATAANDLGTALGQLGRLTEAYAFLTRALAAYRKIDDRRGEANSLNSIGVIHDLQGHYQDASEWYHTSLALNERTGDLRGQAMNLGNIAPIQRRQGQYEEALSSHQRAMRLFVRLGDQYGQTVSLSNLGALYERMGRHAESLTCLEQSLSIYQKLGDRFGEASSLRGLGTTHRTMRNHPLALEHHQRALRICRELGHRDGEAASLLQLGLTLAAIGRATEARTCWTSAAAILDDLGSAEAEAARRLLASHAPAHGADDGAREDGGEGGRIRT